MEQRYNIPIPQNNKRQRIAPPPWSDMHKLEEEEENKKFLEKESGPMEVGALLHTPFVEKNSIGGQSVSSFSAGGRKTPLEEDHPHIVLPESEQYAKLFVRDIINMAIAAGASDIHFEPRRATCRMRFRVDGVLIDQGTVKISQYQTILNTVKILADLNIAEHALPQDGHVEVSVREVPEDGALVAPHDDHEHFYDVRVSTFPSVNGETIVMRLLNRKHALLTLEELGMEEDVLHSLRDALQLSYGMILVTGPTGSGKTTTLYSVLSELKSDQRNIITLEDPIEFHLDWMRQCEIREQRGFTYEVALHSVLRQDPDVLMIGEIRGAETAEQAVRSALVGRIVGTTLHANTAVGTIARLLDLGVPKSVLVHAVRAIIAQRLVRKICPFCREEYTPHSVHLKHFGLTEGDKPFYHGKGCNECNGTGYKGRTGIFSVMLMSPLLQSMVFDGNPLADIQKQAIEEGMKEK